MSATLSPRVRTGELERYLRVLAGSHPAGRLLEVRYALGAGQMRQRFVPAEHPDRAAGLIRALATHSDVYTGVLLRARRAGGRDAVTPSHLAFVEIDAVDGAVRLERLPYPPSMIVASGTPGHLHCYWRLQQPVGAAALERANRRLAQHLGGDLASVDAARILRPAGSANHKHEPSAPVTLLELRPGRVALDELVEGLPHPPTVPARSSAPAPRRGHPLDDALLALPAEHYARMLAGLEASRAGKLACPFHADHTPSLQLYADGGWYCFGCQRGGTIYDFAAALWGTGTKHREFIALRDRLAHVLGISTPRPP
ncbi:MAG: CHC2 zinc finger domain-containing protein [Actinomycetota bacterium]|nr:CHC2 zinc finger domain-containing protein [Actinomycetota bacterium]